MSSWAKRFVVTGAVAQAAGVGIDAWLHLRDPSLAAREALLDLSNVGHVLLLAGIALVVLGAGLVTIGTRIARARAPVRIAVPLVLAVVVGLAGFAASNSSLATSHDHTASQDHTAAHDHGAHGHGDGAEPAYVPVDAETRDILAEQLVRAREVALRYPTQDHAEADGYKPVTPYVAGMGAHLMKFTTVDGTFDIEQPEMLLYGRDGEMVGLSYYVVSDEAPEGFAGPNDHWHRHIGLCIDTEDTFVVGDEETSEAECRARGGVKAEGADGWMVHAWVVPGWDSPSGVFSGLNAQLD